VRTTIETPELKVIDDLLSASEFERVAQAVETLKYKSTIPQTSIWRPCEAENPLESVTSVIWPSGGLDIAECAHMVDETMRFYPTGTDLDRALIAVKREATSIEETLGKEGKDWVGLIAYAYAYGSGTRADWHADAVSYTGAFTYYVHRSWNTSWGGDLLVQSPCESRDVDRGVFVSPLPNRLVLLKGGTLHSVARISSEAGANVRRTIAGFFVTPDRAAELISSVLQSASS
jgi:hypothetical protein